MYETYFWTVCNKLFFILYLSYSHPFTASRASMELSVPSDPGGDRRGPHGARGGVRDVLARGRRLAARLRGRRARPHYQRVGVAARQALPR